MDSSQQIAARTTDGSSVVHSARPDATRTLSVTATFRLSEEGRKLSLLAGGDGKAVQQITLAVPTTRLHLVNVSPDGTAVLKLQPQYHLMGDDQVVRNDAPPTYDAPPSLDDLFKDAARNHQLERSYNVGRAQARDRARESRFEAHQRLAERFLSDPEMRALRHPKPTPRQCYIALNGRPVLFDAKQHRDFARQVPPEAHRRFIADERARSERGAAQYQQNMELHRQRLEFIANWISQRGTADQKARHAAGVLPMKEFLEALADDRFAAVAATTHVRDGAERLQRHLRKFPRYSRVVVTGENLSVTTSIADTVKAAHWSLKEELEAAFPEAKMTLRVHRLSLKDDPSAPTVTQLGVLVFVPEGPFTVKREFVVPDSGAQAVATTVDSRRVVGLQTNLAARLDDLDKDSDARLA